MHRSCARTSAKGHTQLARGTRNQTGHPRLAAPALRGATAAARRKGVTALRETTSSPREACSHCS